MNGNPAAWCCFIVAALGVLALVLIFVVEHYENREREPSESGLDYIKRVVAEFEVDKDVNDGIRADFDEISGVAS